MEEPKISQPQREELELGGVKCKPAVPPEGYANGAEALQDLLAKLEQARNEYRAAHPKGADAALSRIASIGEALVAASNPLPGLDSAQVALVSASALTLRGRTRERTNRADEAKEDWMRAVELFDRYIHLTKPTADTWGYYGVALRILGRRKEAIQALQAAFAGGTGAPELYRHLGWALKEEGRYPEAEEQ